MKTDVSASEYGNVETYTRALFTSWDLSHFLFRRKLSSAIEYNRSQVTIQHALASCGLVSDASYSYTYHLKSWRARRPLTQLPTLAGSAASNASCLICHWTNS